LLFSPEKGIERKTNGSLGKSEEWKEKKTTLRAGQREIGISRTSAL
jgi:hypothetical protein